MRREVLLFPVLLAQGEKGLQMILDRPLQRCVGGASPVVRRRVCPGGEAAKSVSQRGLRNSDYEQHRQLICQHRQGLYRLGVQASLVSRPRLSTPKTYRAGAPPKQQLRVDVRVFRYTAKVSCQVLRFLKHCFLKPASPALYERELRPLLMAYL